MAEELQLTLGLLVRQVRAASAADGVTLSQTSVLKHLAREGSTTAVELARAEKVRPQSVIATVNALQEQGFVARTPHPTDGRQLLIALTAQGREFLRKRQATGLGLLAQLMTERFTPAEQQTLAAAIPLLRRLAEH